MKELILAPKILLGVILLLLIIVGVVSFKLYTAQNVSIKTPQDEAAQLVAAVGKIADLPSEVPTIATVTDKSKLSQYPFFSKAELGDKVLLFNSAKKAYLYRPSTGKLIEVGPIAIANNGEASSSGVLAEASNSAQAKKYSVTILNGTKTAGLAGKVETALKDKNLQIEVTQKGNSKNDYPKTVISAKNPEAKTISEALAKELNAKVETLPQGENEPKTDIIIFVGDDQV